MTTQSDRFPVRCPDCGHVNWFDKNVVCGKSGRYVVRRGPQGDELLLPCEQCEEEMTHTVDCEGYR